MKIQAFTKTYDGRRVLDFPGYEFEPGKIYAILGANGSGKSTFAKVLSGIEKADDKRDVVSLGLKLGYMPQKSYAFRMSTLRNVMLTGADEAVAMETMTKLGIEKLAEKNGNRLSGGETARMALARLLVADYDAVLLDEPSASMDIKSVSLAEQSIKDYRASKGATVILVTHSLQQARRMADVVLFFDEGILVEEGEASKLLYEPEQAALKEFLRFYG